MNENFKKTVENTENHSNQQSSENATNTDSSQSANSGTNVNEQSTVPKKRHIESFKCQNCGGKLGWNIRKHQFMCSSCASPFALDLDNSKVVEHPLSEYETREAKLTGAKIASTSDNSDDMNAESNVSKIIYCRTCGAEIEFGEYQTSTVCPMCGSSQVDVGRQTAGIPPDGVVAFRIDADDAQNKFRQWVKKRWFAPNKLKVAYQTGKLNGVYIPFWTYDTDATAHYSGLGGRVTTYRDSKGNTRTKTSWYPVSGRISYNFDDYPICAGNPKNSDVLVGVLPFNTQLGSYPYSDAFLSGIGSEHYAFSAIEGFKKAKPEMDSLLKEIANQDIISRGYSQAQVTSIKSNFSDPGYKQILAPVWTSNFTYNKKNYVYAINGETGKVTGQRPYSAVKIAIAVIIATILFTWFCIASYDDGGNSYESSGYYESYTDSDSYYNNYNGY